MKTAPQNGQLIWLFPTDEIQRIDKNQGGFQPGWWWWSGDEWRSPFVGGGVAASYCFKGWTLEACEDDVNTLSEAYPTLKLAKFVYRSGPRPNREGGDSIVQEEVR